MRALKLARNVIILELLDEFYLIEYVESCHGHSHPMMMMMMMMMTIMMRSTKVCQRLLLPIILLSLSKVDETANGEFPRRKAACNMSLEFLKNKGSCYLPWIRSSLLGPKQHS